jgi:hypothetical protein
MHGCGESWFAVGKRLREWAETLPQAKHHIHQHHGRKWLTLKYFPYFQPGIHATQEVALASPLQAGENHRLSISPKYVLAGFIQPFLPVYLVGLTAGNHIDHPGSKVCLDDGAAVMDIRLPEIGHFQ